MTPRTIRTALPALALAGLLAAPAAAQFTVPSGGITEALTVAQIESALTTAGSTFTGTSRIDGLALGPGNTLFIAHSDSTEKLTIAQIDLGTGAASWVKEEADIVADLGFTAGSNLTLVGEMVYDPDAQILAMASDINWTVPGDPYTVFAIDTSASPYTASVVLSDASLQGWNSHDLLSDGTIIGTLGEEYEVITGNEPVTGRIDTSGTPAFVPIFTADDFKTASGITGELPPETLGVDLNTDTVYVFGHDNFELLSFNGVTPGSAPTDIEILGWDDNSLANTAPPRVDFHGLDVDADGTVFGFDEAAPQIAMWDGNDTATDVTGSLLFTDITSALLGGGTTPAFSATVWRGMKARTTATPNQSEVFLASATADYGVVRVVVDKATPASVTGWQMYE